MTAAPVPEDRIAAVRRFSRTYTRRIGVLGKGLGGGTFSLTESRVLFELATRDRPTAAAIGRDLGLDAGYLSRLLRRFELKGWIRRERSGTDGRQSHLGLTPSGRSAFAPLHQRSQDEAGALLARLPEPEQQLLVGAMAAIESLLDPERARPPVTLRTHRPGDMGWVVHRHGVLYAREYGWDERFEALVAEITAAFIRNLKPARERCWIAERGGAILGSVFLVEADAEVAKLRLLYVEPEARGLGLGRRLVEECLAFARAAGYRRVTLWTNDVLHAARKIYQGAGFRLVASEPHHSFGHDLVGENWELEL